VEASDGRLGPEVLIVDRTDTEIREAFVNISDLR
jgi:hypothetical protein